MVVPLVPRHLNPLDLAVLAIKSGKSDVVLVTKMVLLSVLLIDGVPLLYIAP